MQMSYRATWPTRPSALVWGHPMKRLACPLPPATPITSAVRLSLSLVSNVISDFSPWETQTRFVIIAPLIFQVSEENEKKARSFLQVRCSPLLRGYKSSIGEDEELLASPLGYNSRLAVQLRLSEKKILQRKGHEWWLQHAVLGVLPS